MFYTFRDMQQNLSFDKAVQSVDESDEPIIYINCPLENDSPQTIPSNVYETTTAEGCEIISLK